MGAVDPHRNIFDDTGELIRMARECLTLLETLRSQAASDSSRVSVPSIVAKHFNLSLATAMELMDFANNDLGPVEDDFIREKNPQYVDDAGHFIDPYSSLEL